VSSPTAPDYQNALAQDPAYQQAQANYQAAITAAGAARDAGTNQALIQFGAVPDFASVGAQLGLTPGQIAAITGEIDPSTSTLADQYTRAGDSVLGQINQKHSQALAALRAQLAARGMLESGATGVGSALEGQGYQSNLTSAYNNLLNSLLGLQDTYEKSAETGRDTLQRALEAAYNTAVGAAEKDPGAYAQPPTPPGVGGSTGSTLPGSTVARLVHHALSPRLRATNPISEHGLGMGFA